jgi:hypothetical protein
MNQGEAEQLANRLAAAIERIPAPQNEDERQRLAASRSAAERMKQLLERVPWELTPPGWLEAIQGAFDPVVAAAESFASAEPPPPEHPAPDLPITWPEIERLWSVLMPFVTASIPEESVAEDAASFRRSTGQLTRRLQDEVREAKNELQGLRQQLRKFANERDQALEAIRARQGELETTITEQAGRLNEAIQGHNTEFSNAQDERRSTFTAAMEEHQRNLAKHIEDSSKQTNDRLANVEEQAHDALVRIEEMEQKATTSYATIGGSSVARYFQDDANKEQKQANLWRLASVGAVMLVAIGTIVELWASGGTLEWEETRSRIPLAVAAFLFAGYAAREGGHHRRAARESRKHEVRVSSIDPYLKQVENHSEAEQIKIEYARALFVNTAPDSGADERPSPDEHE